MALARDRNTQIKAAGRKSYPVAASTTIYKGSIVCVNTAGLAVPAADAAGYHVVGIAYAQAVCGATAGAVSVIVESGIYARLAATAITQAMVGTMMFVVDDQTVDDATGTNGVRVGKLVEYISATEGWVHIQDGAGAVGVAETTWSANEVAILNDLA